MKVTAIPMVDYAAFIDSKWHEIVIFVCKMLDTYTMTELWSMDVIRFHKLVAKAEQIQSERQKAEMKSR